MIFTQENIETIHILSSFAASIDLLPSEHDTWESCLSELFCKVNNDGQSALHVVCSRNPTASSMCLLRLLLLFNPSVNDQDICGQTPLSLLLTWCSDETVRWGMAKMLLEAGANPNLCPPGSLTPLMTAVLLHDITLVDLLICHGANVDTRFETDTPLLVPNRSSALSLSANKSQWVIMTYFLATCKFDPNVLFQALLRADPETKCLMRQLLKSNI
jgi:ankyrin repeat protein